LSRLKTNSARRPPGRRAPERQKAHFSP